MPPHLPESTAPGHRPRHAAAAEPSAPSVGGRHHRPETLADLTRLRPVPAPPSIRRRTPEPPGFIETGYPDDVTRAQRRRPAEAVPAARRRPAPATRPEARRDRRGRHAPPPPAVRDVVVQARDWALAPGDRPAIGSHRAPGTMPIESWLLIGRVRRQALLATLVAVGLALVMVPIERHVDVHPISAADRTIINATPGHRAPGRPSRPASAPGGDTAGDEAPAKPKPSAPATRPSPSPSSTAPEPPAIVPPGSGPARSLTVTGSDAIALTFDDGPDPVQTPKILALLDKYGVKATFCLIGANVAKHPEIVRQIVAGGHTLCNHTWNHSLVIGQEPTETIRADLERTTAAIHAAAPGAPIPFFRAPGGNFTDRLVSEAYGEGMTSLYWQVDPQDWNHRPLESDAAHVDRVIRTVLHAVRPGSIILSHDFNQPDTIVAYEQLLPYLTEHYTTGVPIAPVPATTDSAPSTTASGEPDPVQPTADSPTGE